MRQISQGPLVKRLVACLLAILGVTFLAGPAGAQTLPANATVVSSCGAATYTAGTDAPTLQDTSGNSCTVAAPQSGAANALTPISPSGTLESNHVVCAAACNAYGFQVNTTTAAEWVMLFNATTAPVDGAVTPARWYQVPANGTLIVDMTDGGIPIRFTTGWTLVCSTTGPFTKTASALCTFAGEKK